MSLDYYHKHGFEAKMRARPPNPDDTGKVFMIQADDPKSLINFTFDDIDQLDATTYHMTCTQLLIRMINPGD